MISQASVQEVINRSDIVEIIGLSVRLKKRGSNYIGNCPFHNEKTPSFSVSPAKGFFKCFGCGKGGNVVTFVQENEKLSFVETIRWLADHYKIALEETERSPEQIQRHTVEESLRILNEFAAGYFHDTLLNDGEGQAIGHSYFRQRGLNKDTIETFRLGYCPEDGGSFYRAATNAGHQNQLLEKSGLAKERNGQFFDNYRGRVIFPIQSNTGRVLGFGARILKSNDRAPKYINTPENELYVKSRVLYGMYQARQAVGKQDECFLVEGYLDVISLHQAGIRNVVASSGTSLTEDQLRAIGQLTKNLTILYDSDAAGIKAALRGLDMALGQSFNVQLALLPAGEDPDSYVQAHGKSGFEEYIRTHKRDVIGFRMEVGMRDAGDDPVKRNKLVNEVAETISRINKAEDFSLQQHYIREASRMLTVDEAGMVNLVNKYLRDRLEADARHTKRSGPEPDLPEEPPIEALEAMYGIEPSATAAAPAKAKTTDDHLEWNLIRLLLGNGMQPYDESGSVADLVARRVDPELILNDAARHMFVLYYEYRRDQAEDPPLSWFVGHIDPDIRSRTAQIMYTKDEVSHNWKDMFGIDTIHGPDSYLHDTDSTLCYFELRKLKKMQTELARRLQTETVEKRQMKLMQLYLQLKKDEEEILRKTATVIIRGEA
jgi:DNA primase